MSNLVRYVVHGRDKKPLCTRGSWASHSDPKTWSTLDDAVARMLRDRDITGVGFVFSADDNLVGIDLDGCRDAETGEVDAWGQAILNAHSRCFVNLSPSKTGYHIITRSAVSVDAPGSNSKLAKAGKYWKGGEHKKKAIEVYHTERYFTGCAQFEPSMVPLDAFVDAKVIDRVNEEQGGNSVVDWGGKVSPSIGGGFSGPELEIFDAEDQVLAMRYVEKLCEMDSTFRASWERERAGDWSQSEYDMSLMSLLAGVNVTNPKLLQAVLVAHRRLHRRDGTKKEMKGATSPYHFATTYTKAIARIDETQRKARLAELRRLLTEKTAR